MLLSKSGINTSQVIRVFPDYSEEPYFLSVGDSSSQNTGFYIISNRNREFIGLDILCLNNGKLEQIYITNFDIEQFVILKKSNKIILSINEDGYSTLYIFEKGKGINKIVTIPKGIIEYITVSDDENTLALRIKTPTSPSDIYILKLNKHFDIAQISFSMLGGIKSSEIIVPKLVSYQSTNNTKITGWLYKPLKTNEGKFPFLIAVHGGPERQERPGYNSFYQRLLSLG